MVKKKTLMCLFITIMIPFGFALDLDSLIESYDYDYTSGDISVNSVSDHLEDTDLDGSFDSLNFNFETSDFNSSYKIGVIFEDENYIAKFVSLDSLNPSLTIPSYLISKSQYNYTIEIHDEYDSVIFRKDDYQTSILSNYESGYNLNSISDFGSFEDGVSFYLNFSNIPTTENKSVTLFLDYLDSKIVYTTEVSFESGSDLVIVSVPSNEIFASKHSGDFVLSLVLVESKRINLNYSTNYYNYKDFTNSSYFLNSSYFIIDSDLDSLIDSLVFEFSVNSVVSGNYNVSFDLFDSDYNLIRKYFINSYLNSDEIGILNYSFSGEEFYRTKVNGPFIVSNVILEFNGSFVDFIADSVVTSDISYYDFEKPSLPDLVLSYDVLFNESNNITDLNFNVKNDGDFPAFNFGVDFYDSLGFTFSDNVMFLDVGELVSYTFSFNSTFGDELYYVLVDGVNFVDEMNESNNIVSYFGDGRLVNDSFSNESNTNSSSGGSTGGSSGNSSIDYSGSNTSTSAELNVLSGKLSIGAPSLINFGDIVVSRSEQIIEIELDGEDYFVVEDLKASSFGYYTTLSISDLSTGKEKISAENVELMVSSGNVSTLAGSEDLNVINSLFDYSIFSSDSPVVLMERSVDSDGIVGMYGVLPSLKLTIPKYQAKGKYTGTLTYTLIEN